MITNVYLIRHGDVEYPMDGQGRKLLYGPDASLSKEGIVQIEKLADHMIQNGASVQRIFTSPYKRAYQSAEILAQRFKITDLIVRNDLRDIVVPSVVGVLWDKVVKEEIQPSEEDETFLQMSGRVWDEFDKIRREEKGHTIGIVGHGHPIRVKIHLLEHQEILRDMEGLMPDISTLIGFDYAGKGEAWHLKISEEGKLLSKQFITTREGRSSLRERVD